MHPSIVPPPGYPHSYAHFYLMRDYRTICCWIAWFAFTANFLPKSRRLDRWPHIKAAYCFLVDVWALLACNWRMCLPSLQGEFMGFRRKVKRRVARWATEQDDEL